MQKIFSSLCVPLFLLLLWSCCEDVPREAAKNRLELKKVLLYYKYIARDSLKLAAAQFLIDNMPYHSSRGKVVGESKALEAWRKETDSIYWHFAKGHTPENFPYDSLRICQQDRRESSQKDTLPEAKNDMSIYWDIEVLSFRFLKDHIDNAFNVWRSSRFAKGLSFEEFKEYILPYRCVRGYGFLENGKTLHHLFGKYLHFDSARDLRQCIERYNDAINGMRDLNGKTGRKNQAGLYDLYSRDFHECVDIANYGCNILRACGIPTVVEHNICYRNLPGRHYHCCVLNDSIRSWESFNAESSLPGDGDWAFAETMNVYRSTYGAQKDTPYFLKAEGEYVPPALDDPCMKDVTSHLLHTTEITLNCPAMKTCNLAYLATFHRESEGLLPVTWGKINKKTGTARFQHVLPNVLYVLVCYPGGIAAPQGDPFYVVESGGKAYMRPLIPNVSREKTFHEMTLLRKYPRKKNMLRVAEELIGGRFIGANKRDFSDAVTLFEIKEAPAPYFRTYPLSRTGRFSFYRFQAPEEHPYANISYLEWLSSPSFGYTNSLPPKRPHILCTEEETLLRQEKGFVKLLDDESWDKMKWKAEYDGNMATAPGAYPNITLWLKEPQRVTHIRFAPLSADNGIHAGNLYELLYWDNGWQSFGRNFAEYEYIIFRNVPAGKLYWLRNLNEGREEQPFLFDGKRQRFLYGDLLPD